jgi:hypothetical protein
LGARLRPILGTDVGHWDVPDVTGVLPEAWELVEDGLLDPDGFRDLVFGNAVALWAGVNPDFFAGTVIEAAAGARP